MAEPILTVEHLIKAYGETPVLDDISFAVKPGEVIVVVGPSGCGKSTLLRCLNGLEPTQSGRVRLGSETVAYGGKNLTQLRQRIGMVFQSYELFPHLTVLDNILLAPTKVQKRPKAEVQKEAEALLDRVGLLNKKNSYPRELSGGQKQRVAIVRALCMHPEILLFDEVTAALDPEMVREVLDVMMDLAKNGRTMIIVTHEMQFARAIADRVLFLDGGKIVEEAPPKEFFDHPKTERAQRFLRTFTFDAVKCVTDHIKAPGGPEPHWESDCKGVTDHETVQNFSSFLPAGSGCRVCGSRPDRMRRFLFHCRFRQRSIWQRRGVPHPG